MPNASTLYISQRAQTPCVTRICWTCWRAPGGTCCSWGPQVRNRTPARVWRRCDVSASHTSPCLWLDGSLNPSPGTGKTAYVKSHLAAGLPQASFTSCLLNFSAQTSANTTQVGNARVLSC